MTLLSSTENKLMRPEQEVFKKDPILLIEPQTAAAFLALQLHLDVHGRASGCGRQREEHGECSFLLTEAI